MTAFLERFRRRSVMAGCDGVRAVAFLALALLPLNTAAFLVILAIAALADPPFEANASAAVVEITGEEEVDEAIRIRQLTRATTTMVGFGLAGLAAAWTSAETVLAADAASFAVSGLLIRSMKDDLNYHLSAPAKARSALQDGFRFLMSDMVSRSAVLATLIVVVAGMAIEGQVAVLGPELVNAGPIGIGLMAMATPAGTLIAVALQGRISSEDVMRSSIAVAICSAALAAIAFLIGGSIAVLVAAFFAVGVMYQLSIAANVIVARRVPATRRATTFGLVQGLVAAAHGVGAWLGGIAVVVLGAEWAPPVALCLVASLIFFWPRRSR